MRIFNGTVFVILLLACLLTPKTTFAQAVILQSNHQKNDSVLMLSKEDMQWWRDAKFGMFIHWGVYAIHGKGEWDMFRSRTDVDEYAKLAYIFNPKRFDANEWVALAKEAGMKYMVLTAKHHDGFSLWDSPASYHGFTSMNTPAHRDFIAEYTKACRNAGLAVGLYYSPLDWRFPGFFFPDLYRSNAELMKVQTYSQLRELLTSYGKIDVLWYDGGQDDWLGLGGLEYGDHGWQTRSAGKKYSGAFTWDPVKLNTMVRQLQPKIVINERSGIKGDFDNRENGDGNMQTQRPWERCYTVAGGWGYQPELKAYPLDQLIKLLVKVVCMDGNLLLNVGPDADGHIPDDQIARLREIGKWTSKFGESIYKTRGGPLAFTDWGGSTFTKSAIYLHVLSIPENKKLILMGILQQIKSAVLLNSNSSVKFTQSKDQIELDVSLTSKTEIDNVIKLSFK